MPVLPIILSLHAFDSINANGQILDTWDFVSGNSDVNDHSHGMECLSIIVCQYSRSVYWE